MEGDFVFLDLPCGSIEQTNRLFGWLRGGHVGLSKKVSEAFSRGERSDGRGKRRRG